MIIEISRPEELPQKIRDLRRSYKVSQNYIAQELGISSASVGRYENGKTALSADTVLRILGFLINRHVRESVSLSLKYPNDYMQKDCGITSTSR